MVACAQSSAAAPALPRHNAGCNNLTFDLSSSRYRLDQPHCLSSTSVSPLPTVHLGTRLSLRIDAPACSTALSAPSSRITQDLCRQVLPVVQDKTCHESASRFPDTSSRPSAARCLGKPAALPYISIAPRVFATQLGFSHSHSPHMAAFPPSASC